MHRQVRHALTLAVVLLIALAACAAPTPTPTAPAPTSTPAPTPVLATSSEQIVGTWFGLSTDGMYHQLNPDGTWLIARALKNLPDKPDAEATFHFEGTEFVVIEISATVLESCGPAPATYHIQLLANGNIKFVKVKEACVGRGRTMAQEHKRVK